VSSLTATAEADDGPDTNHTVSHARQRMRAVFPRSFESSAV
jgi:hypothetical protein